MQTETDRRKDRDPTDGGVEDESFRTSEAERSKDETSETAEEKRPGNAAEASADERPRSEETEKPSKSEVEKGKAQHLRKEPLREVLETSPVGAPSAGEAISDLFSTDEIFHRILATADSEFSRSNRLLFLSGLMAGLSIGLTFLARVTFAGSLGDDATGFLENAFYPIGFVFVILGRQQLFTENTLTPVTLVVMRLSSIPRLLKLWGIVFLANVVGAAVMAQLFDATNVLSPEAEVAAYRFGLEAVETDWASLFIRGTLAGFMVAAMVWLIHAVREATSRLVLVYLIFFLIPSMGLYHCIIGACEITYFVLQGGATAADAALSFQLPVTLGNTVGGVLFVALPNFFQTRRERFLEWEQLSWHEWLRGSRELAGHDNDGDEKSREAAAE